MGVRYVSAMLVYPVRVDSVLGVWGVSHGLCVFVKQVKLNITNNNNNND